MTETLTVHPQILNYYNYNVMCNYVFEELESVIQNGYMYEEKRVLYCASATQKKRRGGACIILLVLNGLNVALLFLYTKMKLKIKEGKIYDVTYRKK